MSSQMCAPFLELPLIPIPDLAQHCMRPGVTGYDLPRCGCRHAQILNPDTYCCETVLQHRQVAAALLQAALVCGSQGNANSEGDSEYKEKTPSPSSEEMVYCADQDISGGPWACRHCKGVCGEEHRGRPHMGCCVPVAGAAAQRAPQCGLCSWIYESAVSAAQSRLHSRFSLICRSFC